MPGWLPRPESKSLPERLADASRELKLARQDGSAEWIGKAAKRLDALVDELPRAQETT